LDEGFRFIDLKLLLFNPSKPLSQSKIKVCVPEVYSAL